MGGRQPAAGAPDRRAGQVGQGRVDPAKLALAPPPDGDPPSQYGLVVDGVRYASACATRHGDYPYCEVLDLPSYSTAKSVVGAVGLMRLEKLYPQAALPAS